LSLRYSYSLLTRPEPFPSTDLRIHLEGLSHHLPDTTWTLNTKTRGGSLELPWDNRKQKFPISWIEGLLGSLSVPCWPEATLFRWSPPLPDTPAAKMKDPYTWKLPMTEGPPLIWSTSSLHSSLDSRRELPTPGDDLSPPSSDCRVGLKNMTQSESRSRAGTKVSCALGSSVLPHDSVWLLRGSGPLPPCTEALLFLLNP
jgi:hypothetical protein